MFTYDPTRLLVAYTRRSTTCRSPHFPADLHLSLPNDDVSIKRVSYTNGCEVGLVVNGFNIVVREADTNGILSVHMGNKVVLAFCARTAYVPMSVVGVPLHTFFVERYRTGGRLDNLDEVLKEFSFTSEDVQWENVMYLEASPIGDAIHMLIPSSSVA
tara:strand:- start:256 stop:729 length:474 start_codon:yes stop_codon:yes gene_type:complete